MFVLWLFFLQVGNKINNFMEFIYNFNKIISNIFIGNRKTKENYMT